MEHDRDADKYGSDGGGGSAPVAVPQGPAANDNGQPTAREQPSEAQPGDQTAGGTAGATDTPAPAEVVRPVRFPARVLVTGLPAELPSELEGVWVYVGQLNGSPAYAKTQTLLPETIILWRTSAEPDSSWQFGDQLHGYYCYSWAMPVQPTWSAATNVGAPPSYGWYDAAGTALPSIAVTSLEPWVAPAPAA